MILDPRALATRQLARDRARTRRDGELLARKIARMTASPLAFLRGAAPLFYEVLALRPQLAEGPGGEGWIVGDAHLENFGAYRVENASGEDEVTFDLNDFDETIVAPWRFDVLRLMTSFVLAGRELGAPGARRLALVERMLDAYARRLAGRGLAALAHRPRPVRALVSQVVKRSRAQLLADRTEVVRGVRRFVRGERYRDLPSGIAAAVPRALARYVRSLPAGARPEPREMELVDAAFRVAGTGSLGALRVAVLVLGHGGGPRDASWILDMKQEDPAPAAATLVPRPRIDPAARVQQGTLACLARPPRMLGRTELRGVSMIVRRLAPQEDKLDLARIEDRDLDDLSAYLGELLAEAHRRGATDRRSSLWPARARQRLLDHTITLAGVHEAAYLEYCRLTR